MKLLLETNPQPDPAPADTCSTCWGQGYEIEQSYHGVGAQIDLRTANLVSHASLRLFGVAWTYRPCIDCNGRRTRVTRTPREGCKFGALRALAGVLAHLLASFPEMLKSLSAISE